MSHACSTLVLHCIDFRFGKTIKKYLERKNLLGDVDIVAVAGATKNVADPKLPTDAEFVLRQIEISKRLHGIKTVILINHTDCGAYGGHGAFADESVERERLVKDMETAATVIKSAHPDLTVKMTLAKISGETIEIEGTHLVMDVRRLYRRLLAHFGPQGWWPVQHVSKRRLSLRDDDTRFEIMVGAILTQNTAWTNVEKALANLRQAKALTPGRIIATPSGHLAKLIRPSGYFNQKTKKLKIFSRWLVGSGGMRRLGAKPTDRLRGELLSLWGIGPETADSILLYSFERPVFVVDAYTRRLCGAIGIKAEDYNSCQRYFKSHLPRSRKLFNEYHALIVAWGKLHGNKKTRELALRLVRAKVTP